MLCIDSMYAHVRTYVHMYICAMHQHCILQDVRFFPIKIMMVTQLEGQFKHVTYICLWDL